jgi:hypothetical protein
MVITLVATPDPDPNPDPRPGDIYRWTNSERTLTVRAVDVLDDGARRITAVDEYTNLSINFGFDYFVRSFTRVGRPE